MHMLNLFRCDHNTVRWINRSLSRIFYTSTAHSFFNTKRCIPSPFSVDEQYFHTSEGRFLFLLKHCTFNNSLPVLCTHNKRDPALRKWVREAGSTSDFGLHHPSCSDLFKAHCLLPVWGVMGLGFPH